jgi:hypothetical protein
MLHVMNGYVIKAFGCFVSPMMPFWEIASQ